MPGYRTTEGTSEEALDAASDMTFPASDPPAWMGSVACVAEVDHAARSTRAMEVATKNVRSPRPA